MIVYLPSNLAFLAKAAAKPERTTTKWGATTGKIRVRSQNGLYICEATDGRPWCGPLAQRGA